MPQTAPELSMALNRPKFLPRFFAVDMSAIIASRGAPLIFPNLSRMRYGIRCCHVVDRA